MVKIAVVGGGRMGLPLACVFGKHGAHVTVCDIDGAVVEAIAAGVCPYAEPGLPELMADLHRDGLLRSSTDTTTVVAASDVVVVIVPAHLTADKEIDLHILVAASEAIGKGLRPGTLVIYETTVSVGATRRKLVPVLERASGLAAGRDFQVAYSPERVKANLVLERLETTPKVVGGIDVQSQARAADVYRTYLGAPVQSVSSIEAAEMTKLAGMLFRDVNIALANELAAFCAMSGIDFDQVRVAANVDGEAGLLMPGIGVGGHCTPVYPYFLTRDSRRMGMPQRISEAAREINDLQPLRQLERIAHAWGPLRGQGVHLLGLGFRPGVKVDTLSPAYALRDALGAAGANVTLQDPHYTADELRGAGFVPGRPDAARIVVLNTAHAEFGTPDFGAWRAAGVEVLLDGRNMWNQAEAEAAGLLYFGIGRASSTEAR